MNENVRDLKDLIYRYGPPDALVDTHSSKLGYAIWGFEHSFCLSRNNFFHNNINEDCNPFDKALSLIDVWVEDNCDIKVLGFLSYDIKNILYPHIQFKAQATDFPYMWFGKPKKIKRYFMEPDNSKSKEKFLSPINDINNLSKYKKIIKKIKNELKAGNTYQINLTMEKMFKINANPIDE